MRANPMDFRAAARNAAARVLQTPAQVSAPMPGERHNGAAAQVDATTGAIQPYGLTEVTVIEDGFYPCEGA